jgi:hypothetical protein
MHKFEKRLLHQFQLNIHSFSSNLSGFQSGTDVMIF